MADYQHTHAVDTLLCRADGSNIPIVTTEGEIAAADPYGQAGRELDAWLAEGGVPDPADPLPIEYSATQPVEARARTTDATPLEVFRFPCDPHRLYEASLKISGVDAGNFASKIMEGRFTWKRITGNALVVGVTVVSDIHDAAAAAWAPNYAPQGTEIVFTVAGDAGRTIDWLLVGSVGVYAPAGLEG